MQRELGVIAVVVAATIMVAPLAEVDASVIDPPTLDWFGVGHTFHYSLSNDTHHQEFNATIVAIDGNELTWNLWDNSTGTEDRLEIRGRNKSRENLNITGVYTFMWVNSTNVDTETAIIGATEYKLDVLASTDTTLVFENDSGNRTFKFDAAKGWLKEGIFRDLDLTWTLLSVGDHGDVPNNLEYNPNFCDETTHYGGSDKWPSWSGSYDSSAVGTSVASICYERKSDGGCHAKALDVSSVAWVRWLLQDSLFEYRHQASGFINFDESGTVHEDGQLIALRPLALHVLTNGGTTANFLDGDTQDVESDTWDQDGDTGDDSSASHSWTC